MIEIVAVTFTEKAAGELKLRLRERSRTSAPGAGDAVFGSGSTRRSRRSRRRTSTRSTASAPSCCASGRSKRAWIRCSPCSPSRRRAACTTRVSRLAAGGAPGSAGGSAARAPAHERARRSAAATRTARSIGCATPGWPLAEWRDFPTPWRRPPFDRDAEIDRLVAALHRLADLTARRRRARDNLFVDTDGVRRLSRQIRLEAVVRPARSTTRGKRGSSTSCATAGSRAPARAAATSIGKDVTRTEVLAARDALFAELQQFRKDADADLAACLQQELAGATARYQALKAAAGALDFADLLARARDLIKSDADVRRHLQRKFTRIFVDEFQDTDPVQAEILLLLAADDPASDRLRPSVRPDARQAVHRRRSEAGDLPVPRHRRRHLLARQPAARSSRRPRAAADDELSQRAGDPAVRQRGVRAGDDRRRRDAAGRTTCRCRRIGADDDSQPAIVALPVPRPYRGAWTAEGVGAGPSKRRCPTPSARSSPGSSTSERLDGRRSAAPTAPNDACRSSRGTSPCCSGAS